MRWCSVFTVFGVLAWLIAGGIRSAADEPVALVVEGKPAAVIVLPDAADVGSAEQRVGELLVAHIQQMSGVRLPIKRERELGSVRLVAGRLAIQTQTQSVPAEKSRPDEKISTPRVESNFLLIGSSGLTKLLGVDAEGVGVGGIRLKTAANAVVLLGGPASVEGEMGDDPDGLRYAAIELLEQLGCGYLWPGPVGKVIPKRATVVIPPLDISYTPQIRCRQIRIGGWTDRSDTGLRHLGLTKEEIENWRKARAEFAGDEKAREDLKAISWAGWHRLGGRLPSFGHAGGGLRDAERHLKEHPEWFALQADGTRDQGGDSRWRLCKSNPELIEHVANDIIERVKADPNLTLVSLDFNDGGSNTGWCLCERCRALDPPDGPKIQLMTFKERLRPDSPTRRREIIEYVSLSDRVVYYWNSIAERVTKVHPHVRFGISVYSHWTHPPLRQKLHPNLVARYVPSDTTYLKGWQEAGLRQVFWRPNILLFNRRDGKLKSVVGPMAEAMRTFSEIGIRQTDFDSILHNWATGGLSYYAAARLNWNPRLTAEEIIADYAARGFGRGAEAIVRYFNRVEELSRKGVKGSHAAPEDYVYTPRVVDELRALLNEAERATAGDAEIAARIAFLRMGLNFTELHELLDDMARRAQEKDPAYAPTKVRRLMDLNYLMMLDIMINHQLAVNIPAVAWGSGGFAKWRPLPPPTARLSDEKLMERVHEPRYGLTGREDSLAALFAAFGLEAPQLP